MSEQAGDGQIGGRLHPLLPREPANGLLILLLRHTLVYMHDWHRDLLTLGNR
jgi:hypothetical protein